MEHPDETRYARERLWEDVYGSIGDHVESARKMYELFGRTVAIEQEGDMGVPTSFKEDLKLSCEQHDATLKALELARYRYDEHVLLHGGRGKDCL